MELEGSPQSGYGSGESGRQPIQQDYHQKQLPLFADKSDPLFTNRRNSESLARPGADPCLMFPRSRGNFCPNNQQQNNFCTLRKPRAPPPVPDFAEPVDPPGEGSFDSSYIIDGSCRGNFDSAEEVVAQFREKQKAGFMYPLEYFRPSLEARTQDLEASRVSFPLRRSHIPVGAPLFPRPPCSRRAT